jgi:glycosyltransferase involved in cell wall biosynthesis
MSYISMSQRKQHPRVGIVIPCFNEEEVLPETIRRMEDLLERLISLKKISVESKIVFVDDGSKDRTWELIERYAAQSRFVSGIKLSRNRGHQNALIAGLFAAQGDALVSIDADLQDDIIAIEEMVDRFSDGAEIVYGVRKRRTTDTMFKRFSAESFYRLIAMLGAESVNNHADYRLLSRRVVECLRSYSEVNLFLRGIVPLIGFKSEIVYYDRASRFAGESKYPARKMIALALDAITSFSVAPLRIITFVGFIIFIASMLVTAWALWLRFFTNEAVPGWTSIVLPMYFLGGIQLFCIGILGEYLGKTYSEVKSRPRYFIEKTVSNLVGEGESAIDHQEQENSVV